MHDLQLSLELVEIGTARFSEALDGLPDEALMSPTALPGWTGRHLVAHVASNATALVNLTRWATTGIETPMYDSPQQRNADIETGAQQAPSRLRGSFRDSAHALADAMASVPPSNWQHEIRTIQGRVLPASEIPWLRAREVMVHTIDLGAGIDFHDLPSPFLLELVDEVVERRSTPANPALALSDASGHSWTVRGSGSPREIHESLGTITALVTGRPLPINASAATRDLEMPPWL